MTCGTQRKKEERVTIDGKFLTDSPGAIKLWTIFGDAWIPKSQIFDSDEDLDNLKEGDEVTIEIPGWLAKRRRLGELMAPMRLASLRMMDVYQLPLGLPFYWRYEASGVLPAAVWAYIKFRAPVEGETPIPPTEAQLTILIEFLRYYIDAPCWSLNTAACQEMADELASLRGDIRAAKTTDDVGAWISRCLDLGIDPL